MPEVTIILPCAGSGSRLGLSIPKELYQIRPGTRLIDFSLNHIKARLKLLKHDILRIVTVISPGKEAVFDYVQESLPDCPVKAVYFDAHYKEWPGSVYSARSYFSEYNVLLPDSVLSLSKESTYYDDAKNSLVCKIIEALQKCAVVFSVCPCNNQDILSKLGAVRVEESSNITAFQDKPIGDCSLFNGFWTSYAFRQEMGRDLYDFLIASVKKTTTTNQYRNTGFFPARAVSVANYRDLGTWDAIEQFCQESHW